MSWLDDVRDYGVFMDTSAYYSYVDRNDQRHAAVKELFEQLLSAGVRLYTANIVVAESHAFVLGRKNRNVAATLLGQMVDDVSLPEMGPVLEAASAVHSVETLAAFEPLLTSQQGTLSERMHAVFDEFRTVTGDEY